MPTDIPGALVGWTRAEAQHGIVLSLQVAHSTDEAHMHQLHRIPIALNDRQIRSLARDLTRAAADRGIQLRPERSWRHSLRASIERLTRRLAT